MKNTQNKFISYEKLLSFPISVLYRMRNCLSYFDMLCAETRNDIMDILYEHYCVQFFEGGF